MTQINISTAKRLQELYKTDSCARAFFDWIDSRTNGARETKARVASDRANWEYGEIVELFKEFSKLDVGDYIVGRKGAETRISWNFDVKSIASMAKGESSEVRSVPVDAPRDDDEEDQNPEGFMTHSFALRPDVKVDLSLPLDLSDKEADRLAGWVKSLPFGFPTS